MFLLASTPNITDWLSVGIAFLALLVSIVSMLIALNIFRIRTTERQLSWIVGKIQYAEKPQDEDYLYSEWYRKIPGKWAGDIVTSARIPKKPTPARYKKLLRELLAGETIKRNNENKLELVKE